MGDELGKVLLRGEVGVCRACFRGYLGYGVGWVLWGGSSWVAGVLVVMGSRPCIVVG